MDLREEELHPAQIQEKKLDLSEMSSIIHGWRKAARCRGVVQSEGSDGGQLSVEGWASASQPPS